MEKPHIDAPIMAFNFSGRRKSQLRSQTCTNLLRILSQCYENPELCKTPQIIPLELASANDSNDEREISEKDVCEHSELVISDAVDHDDSLPQNNVAVDDANVEAIGFGDGGLSNAQAVIDKIENIMIIEEDEDIFEQKELAVDDGTKGINGLEDKGFGQLQQMLMDEIEQVMKGNEDGQDNNNPSSTLSLDGSHCRGGDAVAFLNNQSEHIDPQPIIKECSGSANLQQVDKGSAGQHMCKTIDSSLGENMTCKVFKLGDSREDKSFSPRTNELVVNHEMQKEMEARQSVSANDVIDSSNMIEDGEIEEGEIAGKVSDRLVDISPKVSAVIQVQNKKLSEESIDKDKCPFNDKKEPNRKGSVSLSTTVDMVNAIDKREMEAKDVRNEMACKRKLIVYEDPILAPDSDVCKRKKKGSEMKEQNKSSRDKGKKKSNVSSPMVCSNHLALSAKKSDQNATANQEIVCKEKEDTRICNKRKRGPLSEEKKKEKKRKKRAQKNRELGVKKLKLRPVQKPKPVSLCRHYIKGRCQQGEKCKFSHDTIPLTKSKPCCHFARNSCLKGDDCPFDHELSKYPCTNYASTGSCSRGDNCMFSHKLPLKEDLPSTSNVCVADLKPPSFLHTSNCKKQVDGSGASHHATKASDTGGGLTPKDTEKNMPRGVHVPIPKGISFLSAGKSSVVESNHSTPGSLFSTRNEGLKAGNQTDQSASATTKNSNEIPKRTPAVVPKGINFLSFGKAPLEFSDIKKLTSSSGAKSSLSKNFDGQSSVPLTIGNHIQVSKETGGNVSNSTPWFNRELQKNEFAGTTQKVNIWSFGESSTKAPMGSVQDSLPSSSVKSDKSRQACETSSEHQNLRTVSLGLPSSPLGSSQSADYLARAHLNNTPNSAQKALMSTLAFAAKVESQMKKKFTVGASDRADKETEVIGTSSSSQNNSAKASQILDFLSSVGDKMKQ